MFKFLKNLFKRKKTVQQILNVGGNEEQMKKFTSLLSQAMSNNADVQNIQSSLGR